MKTFVSILIFVFFSNFVFSQSQLELIRSDERFDRQSMRTETSRIVAGMMYSSKIGPTEGYFVYDSETEIPNFAAPWALRFTYINAKGKVVGKMLKLGSTDSIRIGEESYYVNTIKIGNPLLGGFTIKNAVCKPLVKHERSTLYMAYPHNISHEPMQTIYLKDKNKFYPIEGVLGGFNGHFRKMLGDCNEVESYLSGLKEENSGKSALKKLMTDHEEHMLEALELYDQCQ